MAAGVIALVLEANPELRWRDVQHITIRNAQVRPSDKSNLNWFYFCHYHVCKSTYTDVIMTKVSN